jgi:hypothetical protein
VSLVAVLSLLLLAIRVGGDTPQDHPPYRSLEGERAVVFYQDGDSARAARFLAFAEAQTPLPGLPPGVPRGVRLYLAPDESSFDEVTGGRIPGWGAGVAIPADSIMVLPLFSSGRGRGIELRTVLRHEWAHLGLHQHLSGRRAPRWFDEGYAQWASGGWDAMEGWRLRVAFATGRAPPLDSLALAWPRNRAAAELAYGLSATVLEYLVEESGTRGLEVLLARLPEMGFDRALRTTYGVTAGQLEQDWQKYVKKRYGWLLVLSHSLIFWSALSVVLLVMVLIRRRRDREALARLRAREDPDHPAYWLDAGLPPPTRRTQGRAVGSWTGGVPSRQASWTAGPPSATWPKPLAPVPSRQSDPEGAPAEGGSKRGASEYKTEAPEEPEE